MMKAISYMMIGAAGAMAYHKYQENSGQINRSMRRMMRSNKRTMRRLRSIF